MNHEHNWVDVPVSLKGEVFGMEYQVSIKHCTICNLYDHTISLAGYSYEYFAMTAAPGVEGIIQNLAIKLYCSIFGKNATATKFTPGGGSTSGGGVGRPKGYADDNGTPNISSDGILYTLAVPYGIVNVDNTAFYTELNTSYNYVLGSSGSGTSGSSSVSFVYTFTVPETGLYYLYNTTGLSLGSYQIFQDGKSWNEYLKSPKIFYRYSSSKTFEKGTKVYLFIYIKGDRWYGGCPFKYSINSIPICYEPLGDTTINNYNKITINNNTWNGNIYQDNSTNLTYIYPQYTTVNEKNETVTNISNTPIIYNNETKQYYTYDQTTKNYYYITYNAQPTPSPSPTPAPTEKPGGSISTPETGKPGGDTGDTTGILAVLVEIRDNMIQGFLDIKAAFVAGFADLSANFTLAIENLTINIQNFFSKGMSGSPVDPNIPGGGTISTPETGDNDNNSGSGWSWNPLKWLTDLLKDIVEGIIKTIWKLITSLFGFLLWLLSLAGKLFPFIPGQAVLAVTSAVVIVAVIRIIKFITGR